MRRNRVSLMARLMARLTLILLLLSGAGTAAVRLFAYDAAYFDGLRTALLESPGCGETACYQGIRPGGTTMLAAHTLLNDHFDHLRVEYLDSDSTNPYMIEWQQGSLYFPQGHVEGQFGIALVDFVWLPSEATLGEVWLAFGVPKSFALYGKFQVIRYPSFSVHTDAACDHFWNEKAGIIVTNKLAQDRGINLVDVRRVVCDATKFQ